MFYANVVKKNNDGSYLIKPKSQTDKEVLETGLLEGKTLLTSHYYDPKIITRQQQSKIYALLNDINNYTDNELAEYFKERMKLRFCWKRGYPLEPLFSLEDCSKELARDFINYLVDYCFTYDIPFFCKDLHLDIDMSNKMYQCVIKKRCFISYDRVEDARTRNMSIEVHHVNAIGRGVNRNKVDHRGRYIMLLRSDYHREFHNMGYTAFCEKYHIGAIKLDTDLTLRLGLMSGKRIAEFDSDESYQIRSYELPN